MNWKKFFLNKYTIFYILYVGYLIGGSLPGQYNIVPVPYYDPPNIIAEIIMYLFFILPIYFLILLIWDLFKKRYKVFILNIIVASVLFIGYQLIARKILKPFYKKQNTEKMESRQVKGVGIELKFANIDK